MGGREQQWILRGAAFETDGAAADVEFPAILKHLVGQRGLPLSGTLEEFLRPRLRDLGDPFEIGEMDRAVERILGAVDGGEKVCVYGDYDVDGVSSVAVMRRVLQAYGLRPRHFIPRRSSEGYGLSAAALERCMAEGEKPDLMIAVDCGTVSVAEIAGLRAEGVDVIVVDHHEPGPAGRPDVVALVNPKCGGGPSYLCAAGVCFKLGHALLKTRKLEHFDLKPLLELVTLATVADIVPMIGENRLMVRHGLKLLPQTLSPGLRALQEVVGMSGRVSSMDIGFRIGPRLNAAGRMDVPEDALGILTTDCRRRAKDFAARLETYNKRRQAHELKIRREALEMLSGDPGFERDPVIVVGSREWHPGVVGIVASRLMRQFHKPAFVVAIDEEGVGKGSGRSIEGISLVGAINAGREHLVAGGGHDMAAGISVEEGKMDAFRAAFREYVLAHSDEEARRPKLYLDAELALDQLSLEFLCDYELLQPFGNGNPQPIFMAREVFLTRPPKHMKNQHLRLSLRQGYHEIDAVFFGGGERDLPDPPWDIAFTIDRNHFRGRTSLQVIIQDVRANRDAAVAESR
jgi:single-stranded-DNA-specific exonuclease